MIVHPSPRLQSNLDNPPPLEAVFEHRKHRIGAVLRFKGYAAAEVATVPADVFKRGDLLRVLAYNGCGMGIDVERVSDGRVDMVWPEEVHYAKFQAELAHDKSTVWVNGPDICLARYTTKLGGHFDVHRSAHQQVASGQQCLACGHGTYDQFREAVLRWHNFELPAADALSGFEATP